MPYNYTHTSKHSNFLYTNTLLHMRVGVRVESESGKEPSDWANLKKGEKKN